MPEQITVGVITTPAGAHLDAYLSALAATKEIASVVLVDPGGRWEPVARKALGDRLGKVYQDTGAMLQEARPAMALISVEGSVAPPLIDIALEAGCHVLAEKPSCIRADDFRKLVQKADSKHLSLMLALANRLNPTAIEARRLMREGVVGQLYGVEAHIIADQTRLKNPSYPKSWFAKRDQAGGGHLVWLGIHWLDLTMFLTATRVVEVAAFTTVIGGQPIDVEDSAVISMRYENGMLGTFTSGYYLDRGYHQHIKIWGASGWVLLEDDRLDWYTTKDNPQPAVQHFGPKERSGYGPWVEAAVRHSAGLAAAPISSAESLRAIETVFACYDSARSGQTVKIN